MDQEAMVALIRRRGVRDERVLAALAYVPRHIFVEESYRALAYDDHPLPISNQQTISQPYIVALMSEALAAAPGERVLEIGSGSGYQAAILAAMGLDVYTVERIPELHATAAARLAELGYAVHARLSDGYAGWEEFAPYAGILVTAAPDHTPPALLAQLAEGGRLIIPVGPRGGYQTLWKIVRCGDDFVEHDMGGVAFVPLIHAERDA